MTLATGTVVLSATFLEKFYHGKSLTLLVISWVLLGISVLFGLFVFGQYISQLESGNDKVRKGSLELLSLVEWLALFAGVTLFAIFVINNVTAHHS